MSAEIDDSDFVESKIDQSKVQKQALKQQEALKNKSPQRVQLMQDDFFEVADVGHGDEFAAVKPWMGQIREPTGWVKPPMNQNKPPSIGLELEWVHGYRSRDSRNNIGVLTDGTIAYHAAALGIVYDPAQHT